jgi:hypothetical protein
MPFTDDKTLELLGGPVMTANDKPKKKKREIERPELPPITLNLEVNVTTGPAFTKPPPSFKVSPSKPDEPLKGLLTKFKSRDK